MNGTAAQLANALRAALPALDHSDYHEGPGPAEGAAAHARRALRAYERAAKQDAKKAAPRFTVTPWHGEGKSVFHVIDTHAPDGQQPAAFVAAYTNDRAAANADAKKRNDQTAQPDLAELARALRAIVKELNGPMRGYWTESTDNNEQAAREALAAYDRAQQPKPKGAPGRCKACKHYGDDCTCHHRKGARHVRG